MDIQKRRKRSNKHHEEISTEASPESTGEMTIKSEIIDLKEETPKKKRKTLSYEEKESILKELNSIPAHLVREKYGISSRTLRKWRKEKEKIYEACKSSARKAKTIRSVKELDDLVLNYVLKANLNGTPVTGPMVRKQALQINKDLGGPREFRASEGWLGKWKIRKQVRCLRITGEILLENLPAAEEYKEDLRKIIVAKQLQRALVFNMDEVNFPFIETLSRTFVPNSSGCVSGIKKQQERLTFGACCNADGSFCLPLIMIGKSKNPRCLKYLDKTKFPVWYRHQRSALMDEAIFEEWFRDEFVPRVKAFLESKNLPHRVLLLVENCKSHKFIKIDDIEVSFLPQNVTSLIQPMDQGIVQTLKLNYQKFLVDSILQAQKNKISINDHLKTINVKIVMKWASDAWEKVEPYTICKSWNKIWPVEKTDAETQTDDNFPIMMTLDSSVGYESVDAPLTYDDDYRIYGLLQSVREIKGYGDVDRKTVWEWLAKPKDVRESWTCDAIRNQVFDVTDGSESTGKEEFETDKENMMEFKEQTYSNEEPKIKDEPQSDEEDEMILPDISDVADVDPLEINSIKKEEPTEV